MLDFKETNTKILIPIKYFWKVSTVRYTQKKIKGIK